MGKKPWQCWRRRGKLSGSQSLDSKVKRNERAKRNQAAGGRHKASFSHLTWGEAQKELNARRWMMAWNVQTGCLGVRFVVPRHLQVVEPEPGRSLLFLFSTGEALAFLHLAAATLAALGRTAAAASGRAATWGVAIPGAAAGARVGGPWHVDNCLAPGPTGAATASASATAPTTSATSATRSAAATASHLGRAEESLEGRNK